MRHVISIATLALAAALLSGSAGFLYAYEPQREVLTIAVEQAPPAGGAAPLSGTVIDMSGGRLRLDGPGRPVELALPPGVRIEELRALPASGLTPGTRVNIGVERSDGMVAISAIVAMDPAR